MKEYAVEQGSAAWFALRAGIPTASEFDRVLTPKKCELAAGRWKYACRLIAEKLLRWQPEPLDQQVQHVADGKAREPLAVRQLECTTGIVTRPVGLLTTNDGRFGASPDRLVVGSGDTVEVKAPTVPRHMEYLLLGHDDAYRCQVQGQLWIAEADKGFFYSYSERMPAYLVETCRDEAFIDKLAGALDQFSDELAKLTERALSLGVYQAFQEMRASVDAEVGDDISSEPLKAEADLASIIRGELGDHGRGSTKALHDRVSVPSLANE